MTWHARERPPAERIRRAAGVALLAAAAGASSTCAPAAGGPAGSEAGRPPGDDPPTWAGTVAPLVRASCAPCHRPGGSAPFPLVDYADAAARVDRIAQTVRARTMPPWLPDPDVGDFAGDRRLTEDQVSVLLRWASAGAPEGDPAAAPPPPASTSEWSLGEPDLVVAFPADTVPAEGHDLYRNLVAGIPVSDARWVRAVELRPGNERVVHHARMMVDTTPSSRELAARDAERTLEVMHVSGRAHDPDGFFLGWTPGKVPEAGRPDLAWRLEPGTDLVLQLHLRPTGTAQVIRPRAGLYFATAPPAREQALVVLRSVAIDIPPGDTSFVAEESYRLPVAVDVLSIYPHAHYVGRRLEAWASPPTGRRRALIRISDWNFNWQDAYRFARPVRLPAGSVLTMHYTYDNSARNPRNPFDPPRRIVYGLSSTDEMAELILQVLPADPADYDALRADLDRFGYQADRRQRAGALVAQARAASAQDRLDEALDLYRSSLATGSDPSVMAEMAQVEMRRGDGAAAVDVAERAADLSGRQEPRVLAVLARAYAGVGRTEDARTTLRGALELARRRKLGALADSLAAELRTLGPAGRPEPPRNLDTGRQYP